MSGPHLATPRRGLVVFSAVLSSAMYAVDTTIANVALPRMQASMSASQEQILWVITSYMIAGAIATPLAGWLANRFGRRGILLASVGGFTLASIGCGLASDLFTAVIARAIQGAAGAAMMPLGQAAVLDVTAPEDQARTMSILGLGMMFGPLIGPTLGGWLTEALNWRWVYFINVPIGIASFLGMAASLPRDEHQPALRFDMFGFVALSVFLASFQLMLDRGQHLDWFDSREIWVYAILMALCLYLLLVHIFTARDTFVRPALFTDRNFTLGCVMSAGVGVIAFGTIPVTTVMMQTMLGYPPLLTGIISSPRSVGTLISMLLVARLAGRVENRTFIVAGLASNALGLYMLARISLQVDQAYLLWAGLFQGLGSGLMFPPLMTIVFTTLSPALRNEGASMFMLTRSMGASLGIAWLQTDLVRNTATVQSRLAEGVRPDSPAVQFALPDFDPGVLSTLGETYGEMLRQAAMVAYVDAYWFTFLIALVMIPVVMLMRSPARSSAGADGDSKSPIVME